MFEQSYWQWTIRPIGYRPWASDEETPWRGLRARSYGHGPSVRYPGDAVA